MSGGDNGVRPINFVLEVAIARFISWGMALRNGESSFTEIRAWVKKPLLFLLALKSTLYGS